MDTASRPLRSRTLTLIALAVVAAAAVGMFTRPDTTASGDPAAGSHHDGQTSEAASSDGSASTQESPRISPKGGVVLPEGVEQVNGLATGFPDSDLGAVATQVAVSRTQIGFDYDTATAAVRTYAAPEEAAVFEQRARLAVAERRKGAGVPADGEAPAPASYAVTPVAYHLQELTTDYYAVTLLSYITFTTTGGKSKDGFYAGTQLVKWVETKSGGDWKLTAGTNAAVRKVLDADRPKPAAPGTTQFRSEGWIQLNPEQP
jgi:hypothetical protein